jgi:hypothetical protein
MKENRDFKGVWIPKEIWLNTDLSRESSPHENVNIIIQRIKQVIIQQRKVVNLRFHSPLPMLTLLTLSFGKVSMML